MEARRERTKQLRILSTKLQRAFYEKHIGTTRPVLFEHGETGHDQERGEILGFTDNYVRVALPFDPQLVNGVSSVHLDALNGEGLMRGSITSAVGV